MPKNNKVNKVSSTVPYFYCDCGFKKEFERMCDVKKGVERHTRFCVIAQRSLGVSQDRIYKQEGGGTVLAMKLPPGQCTRVRAR